MSWQLWLRSWNGGWRPAGYYPTEEEARRAAGDREAPVTAVVVFKEAR